MPKIARPLFEVPITVRGIPAKIAVTSIEKNYNRCAVSWRLLDKNGYVASWLEKKLTSTDRERITELAIEEWQNYYSYLR